MIWGATLKGDGRQEGVTWTIKEGSGVGVNTVGKKN